jgi:DNA mismatch repair ATPase MutS
VSRQTSRKEKSSWIKTRRRSCDGEFYDSPADVVVHAKMVRELNKVYTNGTLLDPEMLTDEQAGHFISISETFEEGSDSISTFGVSVLDCSTSQFNLSTFEDDVCRTKLETLMRQLRPKELLFTKVKTNPSVRVLSKLRRAAGKIIRVDHSAFEVRPPRCLPVDGAARCGRFRIRPNDGGAQKIVSCY